MRKQQLHDAAYAVATQTREVEEILESALAELTELQARMLRVSSCAGVCYNVLQEPFDHVSATIRDLVKARGSMGQCHVAMAEAKQKIPGLRTVSWGDGDDCPSTAQVDLRVVA
jgi:hypothetical protein